jgi:hypothetical protein
MRRLVKKILQLQDLIIDEKINSIYAFTFPFTFAITSSAIFVGAGA